MTKNLDPYPMAKNRHFSGMGEERRTSRATSRPLDRGFTIYIHWPCPTRNALTVVLFCVEIEGVSSAGV